MIKNNNEKECDEDFLLDDSMKKIINLKKTYSFY